MTQTTESPADNHPSRVRLVSDRKRSTCSTCYVRQPCFLSAVSGHHPEDAGPPIAYGQIFRSGDRLYSQGEDTRALYTVRTGSVKTITTTPCGVEQVQGFYLVGDLFGLDCIASGRYTCSAVALEDTSVCSVALSGMESLCRKDGDSLHRLLVTLAEETAMQFNLRMLMSHSGAVQRVATFLTALSRRLGSRWLSDTELWLSMSRHDISSYLGTAPETVSRALSKLVREGALTVSNKRIRITDPELLSEYAEGGPGRGIDSHMDRMESCRELRV